MRTTNHLKFEWATAPQRSGALPTGYGYPRLCHWLPSPSPSATLSIGLTFLWAPLPAPLFRSGWLPGPGGAVEWRGSTGGCCVQRGSQVACRCRSPWLKVGPWMYTSGDTVDTQHALNPYDPYSFWWDTSENLKRFHTKWEQAHHCMCLPPIQIHVRLVGKLVLLGILLGNDGRIPNFDELQVLLGANTQALQFPMWSGV